MIGSLAMQRGVACSPAAVCVTRPQGVPCQVQVRSNSHRRQRAAVALNCVPPGASAQLHGDDVTFGSRQGLHHANREDSPYDAESISSLQGGGLQGFYENRRREDEEEELDHHQSHHSQVSGLHGVSHATAAQAAPAGPSSQREPKYKTVMLKVSGEALQGKEGSGIDSDVLHAVASEVAEAARHGVMLAIVVGGGNYFRGADATRAMKMERTTADYVGMLATVMNALCLQSALEAMGVETRVQTAIEMREVAEPYIRRRAISHLRAGRVVIFGAGTGNPFFTTDTAAALRAAEMNAEVFLKATKVDGVYDSDPTKNPHARRYDRLSYRQVSMDSLQVMDETAITLCKENNIPVIVFNIMEKGNILKAALGEPVGTVVCETAETIISMDGPSPSLPPTAIHQ